jgi:hypothetical protein
MKTTKPKNNTNKYRFRIIVQQKPTIGNKNETTRSFMIYSNRKVTIDTIKKRLMGKI